MPKGIVILKFAGVMRGPQDKGMQYYQISGEDANGLLCVLVCACKACYSESVEKTFNRLVAVEMKKEENNERADERLDS